MTAGIHTIDVARCFLCGGSGRLLYRGLADRLFSAPGSWNIVQCPRPGCGLLWLNPMPAPEEVHKAYAAYYTHASPPSREGWLARLFAAAKRGYVANRYRYSASAWQRLLGLLPWLYPGRTSELDFSVMWLHGREKGRLLDVGAGSGWLVEQMNALGWRAEGLDFDPRAVEHARARGLTMHRGALRQQRFPDASFDAVTMSHSLEHMHDPLRSLSEARRILKPGGRLALATPNARSLLHRRFGSAWYPLDPPRHLYLFNRAALESLMRAAEFTSFRIFTSVRDANGAMLASRAIRRSGRFDMTARQSALGRLWGRAVQLQETALLRFDPDAGEDLVVLAER